MAWCRKYLEPKYTVADEYRSRYAADKMHTARDQSIFLTAEDCWRLRGGVTHQASLVGRKGAPLARVVFSLPSPSYNLGHMLKSIDGEIEHLQIDLATFCEDMIDAVHQWCEDVASDAAVLRRLDGLVGYRKAAYSGVPFDVIG